MKKYFIKFGFIALVALVGITFAQKSFADDPQLVVYNEQTTVTSTSMTIKGYFNPGSGNLGNQTLSATADVDISTIQSGQSGAQLVSAPTLTKSTTTDVNGNFTVTITGLKSGIPYVYTVASSGVNALVSPIYSITTTGTKNIPDITAVATDAGSGAVKLTISLTNVTKSTPFQITVSNTSALTGYTQANFTAPITGNTPYNYVMNLSANTLTTGFGTEHGIKLLDLDYSFSYDGGFFDTSTFSNGGNGNGGGGNGQTGMLVDLNAQPSFVLGNVITFTGLVWNASGAQPSNINVVLGQSPGAYTITGGAPTSDAAFPAGAKSFSLDITDPSLQPNTTYYFALEIPQGSGQYYLTGSTVTTGTGVQNGSFSVVGNSDSNTWITSPTGLTGYFDPGSFVYQTTGSTITTTVKASICDTTTINGFAKISIGTDGTTFPIQSDILYDGPIDNFCKDISYPVELQPQTTYYYKLTGAADGATESTLETTQGIATPALGVGLDSPAPKATDSSVYLGNNISFNFTTLCGGSPNKYCFLAPLPIPGVTGGEYENGQLKSIDVTTSLSDYLNGAIKFIITLAGGLAVIMIVVGGIEYMASDAVTSKEGAKQRIWRAIGGLLLALGAFAILNTINPNFVNGNLTLTNQTLQVIPWQDSYSSPESTGPVTGNFIPQGVSCPGSGGQSALAGIAQSFEGHTTYIMGGKGGQGPVGTDGNPTVYLDCSGFVNKVLQCSGLPSVPPPSGGGTQQIFAQSDAVTTITKVGNDAYINSKKLTIGDLVGWEPGEGGTYGHVLIYVGGGNVMDSHGSSSVGNSVAAYDLTDYHLKAKIKHVKWQ